MADTQDEDGPARRTTATPCPHCGNQVSNICEGAGKGDTMPGNWMICGDCAEVAVLDSLLRPVLPPAGAYEALAASRPVLHWAMEHERAIVRRRRDGYGPAFPVYVDDGPAIGMVGSLPSGRWGARLLGGGDPILDHDYPTREAAEQAVRDGSKAR